MVKIFLRILGLMGLWGVVVGIVVWIDPDVIRDVIIPGFYLPMWGATSIAIGYTIFWIMGFSKYSVLISLILSIFVALLLFF